FRGAYISSTSLFSISLHDALPIFTALLVYGVVTWAVEVSACKSIALRTFWSGRSVILMNNGTIIKENLRRATIDLNEFLGQARIDRKSTRLNSSHVSIAYADCCLK